MEAIYWHPGMKYHIDRIYLLKPVQFASIRRNEVKATLPSSAVLSAAKGGEVPMLCTAENIQQRAALVLQDVHYVIECHFTMTEEAAPGDNPGKFQDIPGGGGLNRGSAITSPALAAGSFRKLPDG